MVLQTFGSLETVFQTSRDELDAALPGLGAVVHATRDVSYELARRTLRGSAVCVDDLKLRSYLKLRIGTRSTETLFAVFADHRGVYIADDEIALGGRDVLAFRYRDIFRRALVLNAGAVLLAHNHPSGRALASDADVEMTNAFARLSAALSITLIDHLVVTAQALFSIRRGRPL